jgi:O-antigen/teichoic acid export membrane protein
LFSGWFGLDVLAYLNLAILVLVAPSVLLNKAVGDAYYPLAARLVDDQRGLLVFLTQCTAGLFVVLLMPFLLLGIYAEPIYALLFSEQWRQAGVYCLWLMPWYFLVCLNAPALKTLMVLRQQKFSFYLNIVTFVLRCLAIAVGALIFNSVWWALALYCAVGCIHNLVIIGSAFTSVLKHSPAKGSCSDAVT